MVRNRKLLSVVLGAGQTFALMVGVLVPHLTFAGDVRAPQADFIDDPLRALLTKSGYTAVPIDLTDPTRPIVHGQINGNPASFVIDTATNKSSLRRDVVEKFKLPVTAGGKVKASRPHTSGKIDQMTTTVERLKIGDALLPHCQLDVDDWLDGLDPAARQKAQRDDPWVGIIGDNTLAPNQCVVDLGGGTLYIRRPEAVPDRWLRHELATFFAAEKYVEVPCTKMIFPWLIDCKVGGQNHLLLIVDTGCRYTDFDHAVAARFGFKGTVLPPERAPVTAPDAKPTISGPLPAPLVLPGGFQVPEHTPVLAYDFTAGNRGLNQQGLPSAHGSIGVDLLRHYSAVIDYLTHEPRLFLIDPLIKDRRMLVGRWECAALEVSGQQMAVEDAKKCRLAIVADLLDLQLWTGRQLMLTIDAMRPDSEPKALGLSIAGRSGKRYHPAIYEVSRDQLRLCLPLDVKPGEKVERPREFKCSPGSPYAVFTFRRIQAK